MKKKNIFIAVIIYLLTFMIFTAYINFKIEYVINHEYVERIDNLSERIDKLIIIVENEQRRL